MRIVMGVVVHYWCVSLTLYQSDSLLMYGYFSGMVTIDGYHLTS